MKRKAQAWPAAPLQAALEAPWCRQQLQAAAEGDMADAAGWVTLYCPRWLGAWGEVSVRAGHERYPDGLTLIEDGPSGRDIWTFYVKGLDEGSPRIDARWCPGLDEDDELLEPASGDRYRRAQALLESVLQALAARERQLQAAREWTAHLDAQLAVGEVLPQDAGLDALADLLGPPAAGAAAAPAPWQRWWRQCRAMERIARRRGWRVTPLLAAPPATEAEVQALEQAHGVQLPPQLRTLLTRLSAELQFGWQCAGEDEPTGELAALYAGGIRGTLWSLDMIDHQALVNLAEWRSLRKARGKGAQAEPVRWDRHFAFAYLANGDVLTLDMTDPDPARQAVRYFSHESQGLHGQVLAEDLHAFLDRWCALGVVGQEQHGWKLLCAPGRGPLDAQGSVALQWLAWLRRDPALRDPDEFPRPILARSEADRVWLAAARSLDRPAMEAALAQGAQVDCTPDDWQDAHCTAVIHAVKADELPLLQWLHEQGASLSTRLLSVSAAVVHGRPATLQWLIDKGARLDRWRDQRDCPLHQLIHSDRTEEDYRALLPLLLKAGADPDAWLDPGRQGDRRTALMGAGPWTTRQLLEAGADPHRRDAEGRTALHHARQADVVALLVQAGLDPNDDVAPAGGLPAWPPLHAALRRADSAAAASALLAAGADPHRLDAEGRPAWFHCLHPTSVELLLALGFEVGRRDGHGRTLLHHLLLQGSGLGEFARQTAELLLQRGLDINAADQAGKTALHVAAGLYASGPDRAALEFLLRHGADRGLLDAEGRQPWQCLGRQHKAALALLKPA